MKHQPKKKKKTETETFMDLIVIKQKCFDFSAHLSLALFSQLTTPVQLEVRAHPEEGVRVQGPSGGCRSRPAMSRSNCDCHVDGEERDWKISKLT